MFTMNFINTPHSFIFYHSGNIVAMVKKMSYFAMFTFSYIFFKDFLFGYFRFTNVDNFMILFFVVNSSSALNDSCLLWRQLEVTRQTGFRKSSVVGAGKMKASFPLIDYRN